MANVILSRDAYRDLVEIVDYGEAQFGREAADAYQDAIDRAFERRLGSYPRSGEARPRFGRNVRCLLCNRHRILYEFGNDTLVVLRILHHSRDVQRHLAK